MCQKRRRGVSRNIPHKSAKLEGLSRSSLKSGSESFEKETSLREYLPNPLFAYNFISDVYIDASESFSYEHVGLSSISLCQNRLREIANRIFQEYERARQVAGLFLERDKDFALQYCDELLENAGDLNSCNKSILYPSLDRRPKMSQLHNEENSHLAESSSSTKATYNGRRCLKVLTSNVTKKKRRRVMKNNWKWNHYSLKGGAKGGPKTSTNQVMTLDFCVRALEALVRNNLRKVTGNTCLSLSRVDLPQIDKPFINKNVHVEKLNETLSESNAQSLDSMLRNIWKNNKNSSLQSKIHELGKSNIFSLTSKEPVSSSVVKTRSSSTTSGIATVNVKQTSADNSPGSAVSSDTTLLQFRKNYVPQKRYRGCRRCRNHGYEVPYHPRKSCPNKECDCKKASVLATTTFIPCLSLQQKAAYIHQVMPILIKEILKAMEEPSSEVSATNRILPIVRRFCPEVLEVLDSESAETVSASSSLPVLSFERIPVFPEHPHNIANNSGISTEVSNSYSGPHDEKIVLRDIKPFHINTEEQRTLKKFIEYVDLTSEETEAENNASGSLFHSLIHQLTNDHAVTSGAPSISNQRVVWQQATQALKNKRSDTCASHHLLNSTGNPICGCQPYNFFSQPGQNGTQIFPHVLPMQYQVQPFHFNNCPYQTDLNSPLRNHVGNSRISAATPSTQFCCPEVSNNGYMQA